MHYLTKLLIFFKNWWFIGILITPLFFLCFVEMPDNLMSDYNRIKDMIEFLTWLFSGVMTLITFLTIFIAYTYENKLSAASSSLKTILNPYGLTVDRLRNLLIDYQNSIQDDKTIKFIFYGFTLFSSLSILTWGIAVGFYTKFKYSFIIETHIEAVLYFSMYSFYILITIVFIFLSIILKLIILKIDPIKKGYLPPFNDLLDFEYLDKEGNIEEIFKSNPISIDFFKNPTNRKKFKYEVIVSSPIYIKKFSYVIKIYDKNNNNLVTLFGRTNNHITDLENVRDYNKLVTDDFEEDIYRELDQESYGVYKVFDMKLKVVASYLLYVDLNSKDHVAFTVLRKLKINSAGIENDGNIFNGFEHKYDFGDYQIEVKSNQ